jgi:hypothetical protein
MLGIPFHFHEPSVDLAHEETAAGGALEAGRGKEALLPRHEGLLGNEQRDQIGVIRNAAFERERSRRGEDAAF